MPAMAVSEQQVSRATPLAVAGVLAVSAPVLPVRAVPVVRLALEARAGPRAATAKLVPAHRAVMAALVVLAGTAMTPILLVVMVVRVVMPAASGRAARVVLAVRVSPVLMAMICSLVEP